MADNTVDAMIDIVNRRKIVDFERRFQMYVVERAAASVNIGTMYIMKRVSL